MTEEQVLSEGKKIKKETREEKRNRYANETCRELRHLLTQDGYIGANNYGTLFCYFNKWMRATGKIKYVRP
jgi:hypothetical protein